MIRKAFTEVDGRQVARVTFSLPGSIWADSIYLVGDFNDWNQSSHPFRQTEQGMWTFTVDLEVSRAYQFRYRRDGEWTNDGQADAYLPASDGREAFIVETDPGRHAPIS